MRFLYQIVSPFMADNEGIQRIEANRSEFSTVGLHNPTIGLFLGTNQKRVKGKASLQTFIGSNSNQSQLYKRMGVFPSPVFAKALLETALERAGDEDSGYEEEMVKVFTQPHYLQSFVQSTFKALPSDQVKDSSLHIHLLTTFTLSLDWMDFYNFHDQRMHEVRRKLLLWSFFGMGDKERGLRGHAKESILLATEEYTSYNSNVMMCGML
ncbi:hypothetical protein DVH24_008598 [Malus domestica]|uniref:Uncharacterized protein n=1 Tax=Malus domestica TaxID=3750 RepID=A0A498JK40_MALDO|nr:hypothetical protein DVH24_008598 [Malus domestica]